MDSSLTPLDEDEDEERRRSGPWLYMGIGCGLLVLCGLCLVPPMVYLGYASAEAEVDDADDGRSEPSWDWLGDDDEDSDPDPVSDPPTFEPAPSVEPPAPPTPSPTPPGPTGPGVPLPPPPSGRDLSPRHIRAHVIESTGVPGLEVGASCEFDVTRHDQPSGTFWCNAQVRCGGRLLYGGEGAGFFDCTLYQGPDRHVVGEDPNESGQDRDAAMRIDTLDGSLQVHDDEAGPLGAFRVRAQIDEVR